MRETCFEVFHISNLMKEQIEGYDIAAIDATSFHVLNEPGRQTQTKSYAYCIRGGPPDKRVILYEYNAYSHKSDVDETLHYFKGTIHCDASSVVQQNRCQRKRYVELLSRSCTSQIRVNRKSRPKRQSPIGDRNKANPRRSKGTSTIEKSPDIESISYLAHP